MNTRTLLQEITVHTEGGDKQNPPLVRLSAATLTGLDTALVQLELGRENVELRDYGNGPDGIPYVTLQHADDTMHVWETYVELHQMRGWALWAGAICKDHLKITLVKGN